MIFIKKVFGALFIMALIIALVMCIGRINELERDYADLESQVCNYMTGEAYGIRIEHDDEVQYWVHKNNDTLFEIKGHLICY